MKQIKNYIQKTLNTTNSHLAGIWDISRNVYDDCLSKGYNFTTCMNYVLGRPDKSIYELRCKKTGHRAFKTGWTQTILSSYRKWVKSFKFQISEEEELYYRVAKTLVLTSCAVTVQLICNFIFANAKILFSRQAAHIMVCHSSIDSTATLKGEPI